MGAFSTHINERRSMTLRRLLVLGATGGTGSALVAQALEQGHIVTALVRDPSRFGMKSDRLRVITGDVTRDDAALADAIRNQDAVISALGVGKSFKSNDLIGTAIPRVVSAMLQQGVRRLIHMSAFGVGDTWREIPLLPKFFTATLLKDVYRDKANGDKAIQSSPLTWTIVYPTGLSDRPGTGQYRSGEHVPLRGMPTISRSDVAAFLLSQVDDALFLRKGVFVTS
jgi:putative NADH-flavin reductase